MPVIARRSVAKTPDESEEIGPRITPAMTTELQDRGTSIEHVHVHVHAHAHRQAADGTTAAHINAKDRDLPPRRGGGSRARLHLSQ